MAGDPRNGRVARIYLVAVVDPPGVLTLVKVETRDWMDRLLQRGQYSPLTNGGYEQTISVASGQWRQLLEVTMEALEVADS